MKFLTDQRPKPVHHRPKVEAQLAAERQTLRCDLSLKRENHAQRCVALGPAHAFIDRALYLPKEWTDDLDRLEAAYVPADIGFATKPRLAMGMIARAIAASVPFRWVAGDTVYGVGDKAPTSRHGILNDLQMITLGPFDFYEKTCVQPKLSK